MRTTAAGTVAADHPYLPARAARRLTRAGLWVLAGVALMLLSGCATDEPVVGEEVPTTQAVLASSSYAASVGAERQRARVEQVRSVVEELREATTGGWQARQDDVTGYAGELSGGRWSGPADPVAAVRSFLQDFGSAFGLADVAQLALPDGVEYDAAGVADVRVEQRHDGIGVEGSSLLVPVTRRGDTGEISLARGRVFDVQGVGTTPAVPAEQAAATVSTLAGSPVTEPPSLVVLPTVTPPRLAWRTAVSPAGDASTPAGEGAAPQAAGPAPGVHGQSGLAIDGPSRVFVDATTGALLDVQPLRAERTLPLLQAASGGEQVTGASQHEYDLPPAGTPVRVPFTLPDGKPAEAVAEQQPDGSLVLVDATGEGADREGRIGLIVVTDGSGVSEGERGPGPVLRLEPGEQNLDALMGMWAARRVLDYYRQEHGRLSYDGRNGSLLIMTGYTGGEPCLDNAYFRIVEGYEMMLLGVSCEEGGRPVYGSYADLWTVGHEVTHGVTNGNLGGNGAVQLTAIDEGTSDYFGTIVQNLATGSPRTASDYYGCYGIKDTVACAELTKGQYGLRDVDTGAAYEDFVFTLNEPHGIARKLGDDGHWSSMVWTNALWKSRRALAQRDGGNEITSQKARAFDRAVHRATSTYLDVSSDLVSAGEAVLRAMGEVDGLDGQDRSTVVRQFGVSQICRGCTFPEQINRVVAASVKDKVRPQSTGHGVVYTQFDTRAVSRALLGQAGSTEAAALDDGDALVMHTAAEGDIVLSTIIRTEGESEVASVHLRDLRAGTASVLTPSSLGPVAPATDGRRVAWLDRDGDEVSLRVRDAAGGEPRSVPISAVPAHLAISGERVAWQDETGAVLVHDLATGQTGTLARFGEPFIAGLYKPTGGLALDGDHLAVFPDGRGGELVVFDLAAGTQSVVSEAAAPFGLALDDGLLVWAEDVGTLPGEVVKYAHLEFPDTELRGYSFATGTYYRLAGQRGQQGFPSLDGRLLSWQDAVVGSNDIFATSLPEGL